MGLFGFGKKTDTASTPAPAATPAVTSAPSIDLTKRIDLNKKEVQAICLTKAPLNGLKAKVAFVIDYSGSMRSMYNNGTVQRTLENIFPIAATFDDDGSMECWIFENGYHRLPDVTINNLEGYIARETRAYSMGGTCYAPVIEDIIDTYKKETVPAYVVFVTDGDNQDKSKTTKMIIEASKYPIFWQFVGIGNDSFDYLQKLDDMEGRYVDNADFFKVSEPSKITYNDLLDEFPNWLVMPEVVKMTNR